MARARALQAAKAWADAYAAFRQVDAGAALSADDLEHMALCAGLSGDDQAQLQTLERAHHLHVAQDRPQRAARAAAWLCLRLMPLGELGRAQAWLTRAERILEGYEDCADVGFLRLPRALRQLQEGNFAEAFTLAESACGLGERFADPDLTALSRIMMGRALLRQGELARGLALLDDAMLTATSSEVSPAVTGLVYCLVISGCSQVFALERAREWTAALSSWCDMQPQLVGFAGACLVHRAEIMELSGAWSEAIVEARRAEERFARSSDTRAGADALYQRAEIHRLRGELGLAEEAYLAASHAGREPLPGLALLRLAQQQNDAALSAMRRVVATTREPLQRTRYLPAYVEILLVVGELETARAAAAELTASAGSFESDVLRALAQQAEGMVLLAAGDACAAAEPLRAAISVWQRVAAPYLVARLRVLLGRAYRALQDHEGAQLEWDAARACFVQLGAALDLHALDLLIAEHHVQLATPPVATSVSSGTSTKSTYKLSARELQVLRLVATGKTNRVIAKELFLSEKTVDRHVSNIFAKTNLGSRAAATAFAYENGLI